VPRTVLLAACVLATAVPIAMPALVPATGQVLLVVAATIGAVGYATVETREPRVGLVGPVVAVAVLLAVAVAAPPRGSHDVWSYVMYGRIVSIHHANPYTVLPAAFAHDPFLVRVASGWRHTPSVYGVTWTAYSAVAMFATGGSALLARLAFQVLAGAAVVAALTVLWRRYRQPGAVAWLGLQPVVWISVVNNGHNDAVVGLGLLAGALLLASGRVRLAAVVLAVAATVKLTALLAVVGGAVWLWRRDGSRVAARFSGLAALLVAAAYAPIALVNSRALSAADHRVSRGSSWNPSLHWFVSASGGRHILAGMTRAHALASLSAAALGVVAIGAVALAVRRSASGDAPASVGAALCAFLFGGAYVLPWYSMWVLPTTAARSRAWTSRVVALQAGVLAAIYQLPQAPTAKAFDGDLRFVLTRVAPVCLVVTFVVAFVLETARSRPRGGSWPASAGTVAARPSEAAAA
jgi:alpha-1,6-mannosyltransferase